MSHGTCFEWTVSADLDDTLIATADLPAVGPLGASLARVTLDWSPQAAISRITHNHGLFHQSQYMAHKKEDMFHAVVSTVTLWSAAQAAWCANFPTAVREDGLTWGFDPECNAYLAPLPQAFGIIRILKLSKVKSHWFADVVSPRHEFLYQRFNTRQSDAEIAKTEAQTHICGPWAQRYAETFEALLEHIRNGSDEIQTPA